MSRHVLIRLLRLSLPIAMLCSLVGCDDSSSGRAANAGGGNVVCDPVANPPVGQYGLELTVGGQTVRFLIFIPQQYASQDRWPLVIFLHGSGERGSDLQKVKQHGTPKWVESHPSFPFMVVSPQLPSSLGDWIPSDVVALVDEIVCRYAVDPNRIYLTGISMGGIGTWATAIEYPDRFAAIAPVSAWGFPSQAAAIRHIPAWVFHGADDGAAPLSRAQAMVDALRAVGGNVTFTVYPGVGHSGAWPPTYENDSLYNWFLAWSL